MAGDELPHGVALLGWLRDRLLTLPDAKFIAVMEMLGVISDVPAVEGLIHEARPRLRVLRPQRPRSLKRPLCLPIEDLWAAPAPAAPSVAVIDRRVIDPLWRHLESHERSALAPLKLEYRRTPSNRPQQLLDIGERLWQFAARVLTAEAVPALSDDQSDLLRDIMMVASEIEAFKRAIPRKPITLLGEFETSWIADQLHIFTERNLPKRGYLLVIAARLEAPAQLLTWLRDRGEVVPPVLEQFIVGKLSGEIARFDREAAHLAPENLAIAANDLLASLTTVEATLGPTSRRDLASRSAGIDGRIRDALQTRIIDAAPREIAAALADAPAREVLLAAESHALALAVSLKSAAKIGLGAAADKAITAIRGACIDRIDDILRRANGGGPAAQERAETEVFQSVRLIELVEGVTSARDVMAEARRRLGTVMRTG